MLMVDTHALEEQRLNELVPNGPVFSNKWRHTPVNIVPYSQDWDTQFAIIATRIQRLCGDNLKDIHHIGSTAIPDMPSKPLIDVMPIAQNVKAAEACIEAMMDDGYLYYGEYGVEGRWFFTKGEPPFINVHMYVDGHKEIERHLTFRDALRADKDLAIRYEATKRVLALDFPTNETAYSDGKTMFVEAVLDHVRAMNEQF